LALLTENAGLAARSKQWERWRLLLPLLGLLLSSPALAAAPPATLRRQLATAPDTARPRLLRQLADHYLYSNFDSAWSYARQAQALARQARSAEGLYRSYGQLGILYGMRGNTEASLRMFLAQLRLNQHRPDSARYRAGILSNIANSYYGQGKYAAAADLLAQARRADAAAHDTAGIVADLNNLNQILLKQGRKSQALQASQEAVRLVRLAPSVGPAGNQAYLCLVNALQELGRYAAARDTALAVLLPLHRAQQGQLLAYAYHLLLRDYLALNQLPEAAAAGHQALAYAQPAGMHDVARDVRQTLSEVAARTGNYAAAYRQQRLADSLTAHLTRESNAKTVQDMQFKYDTERKDAQVAALGQQVQTSRWQLGLGLGLALAALLAAALLYRSRRLQSEVFRQREQLQAQRAEQQRLAEAARRAQEQARQQHLETQRQLEAAERQRLEQELAASQREQTSAALFAQQKTQLLEDLTTRLDALAQRVPEAHRPPVVELKKDIGQHLRVADDWERAVLHFEKIHPEFFALLHQRCAALTPGELKQCAYVKLNLTNKNIASLLNIEPGSVKISHYRIKKKLDLPEQESLRDFILSI
jgi:DNA-binding CsgD family transcriptional regulator